MTWLLLTLVAITARASYGVFVKVMSRKVGIASSTNAVIMLVIAGTLCLLLSPALGGISTQGLRPHAWALFFMIVSAAAGNALFFKGLEQLEAGISQIVFSSILGWAVLLSAIVLGSNYSALQLLGTLVLAAAIFLAQYEHQAKLNRSVIYILLSAALFAIFQVASAKVSRDVSEATYLALIYFCPSLLIGAFYQKQLRRDVPKFLRSERGAIFAVAATVITTTLYNVFAYLAYRHAPDAGVVVLLMTSQVVLAVILGAIFLGERKRLPTKLAAGMVALVAGALIHS